MRREWLLVVGYWLSVCGLWLSVCGLWLLVCGLWFMVCDGAIAWRLIDDGRLTTGAVLLRRSYAVPSQLVRACRQPEQPPGHCRSSVVHRRPAEAADVTSPPGLTPTPSIHHPQTNTQQPTTNNPQVIPPSERRFRRGASGSRIQAASVPGPSPRRAAVRCRCH